MSANDITHASVVKRRKTIYSRWAHREQIRVGEPRHLFTASGNYNGNAFIRDFVPIIRARDANSPASKIDKSFSSERTRQSEAHIMPAFAEIKPVQIAASSRNHVTAIQFPLKAFPIPGIAVISSI